MHLNSFTDFGLRVLMRLADDESRSFSSAALSQEFKVSRHHLTKVIAEMARAGFITTRRGQGGGIRLARPAVEISVGEVVRVMERKTVMVECFREDGGNCTLTSGCRLRGVLDLAARNWLQELERTSIADCAYTGPQDGGCGCGKC